MHMFHVIRQKQIENVKSYDVISLSANTFLNFTASEAYGLAKMGLLPRYIPTKDKEGNKDVKRK